MEEFIKQNIFQLLTVVFMAGMFWASHNSLAKRLDDFKEVFTQRLDEQKVEIDKKVDNATCKAMHLYPYMRDIKK